MEPPRTDVDLVWRRTLESARREIGDGAASQWLGRLAPVAIDRDLAILTAPSPYLSSYVEREYGALLLRLIARHVPGVRRLTIQPPGEAAPASATFQGSQIDGAPTAPAAPPSQNGGAHAADALVSAPLDPKYTFERFVVGKPNELAHAAARRVAETADATFNPVFLHGGVGLGKTHLMHAIAWTLRASRPDCRVLYLSAEQFMYRFVQALRFRDTITFKQQFRSVDVLMVDDVQYLAGKDSTQEEFFHTFNALIDQKKQIVLSADNSPDRIEGLEERIRSRLQWGLVVDIHPADYELRLGILQSKAEQMMELHPEASLDPKVLEMLAHRINQNVRVLEGALTRLFAHASLTGRRIDLDMTQESLGDLLRSSERKVTIEEIKRRVADHYNIRLSDLVSARRARSVARPRQIAMYLAKMLTTKSLPEIGRGFGGRDHTTVIHAVKKIEQLREADAQLHEDVELLRRMLEA